MTNYSQNYTTVKPSHPHRQATSNPIMAADPLINKHMWGRGSGIHLAHLTSESFQ